MSGKLRPFIYTRPGERKREGEREKKIKIYIHHFPKQTKKIDAKFILVLVVVSLEVSASQY